MSNNTKPKSNDRKTYMRQYYLNNRKEILKKSKDRKDNRDLTKEELNAAVDKTDIIITELSKEIDNTDPNDENFSRSITAMELMLDLKILLLS